MNIKNRVLILLPFLILLNGCNFNKDIQVLDFAIRDSFQNCFDIYEVDYELSDGIFSVRNSNKNIALLIDVLMILNLEQGIISENIANANTTITADGGCYLRKVLTIEVEGHPQIEIDNISLTNFVYDPTHPDAIHEGIKRGYVEYPNVTIQSEMCDLIYTNTEIDTILEIIKRIDPSIIVPQND